MKFFPSILICLSLFLYACGDTNPLIGKWGLVVNTGKTDIDAILKDTGALEMTMEFSKSEMIVTHGSTEQRVKVTYRKNEDNSWSVSPDGGKVWQKFIFKDENTFIQNAGIMNLTFKRVK
jgi:hypothetical protein